MRALVDRATNSLPLPRLFSRRLLSARVSRTTHRIIDRVIPSPLYGWEVMQVRRALTDASTEFQQRTQRKLVLNEQWRERDRTIFGRANKPTMYQEG